MIPYGHRGVWNKLAGTHAQAKHANARAHMQIHIREAQWNIGVVCAMHTATVIFIANLRRRA